MPNKQQTLFETRQYFSIVFHFVNYFSAEYWCTWNYLHTGWRNYRKIQIFPLKYISEWSSWVTHDYHLLGRTIFLFSVLHDFRIQIIPNTNGNEGSYHHLPCRILIQDHSTSSVTNWVFFFVSWRDYHSINGIEMPSANLLPVCLRWEFVRKFMKINDNFALEYWNSPRNGKLDENQKNLQSLPFAGLMLKIRGAIWNATSSNTNFEKVSFPIDPVP